MKKLLSLFLCVSMLAALCACGETAPTVELACKPGQTDGNGIQGEFTVYTPDEKHIVEAPEKDVYYVNNMIIVVFKPEATQADINRVIASVKGTVVGRIEAINQYQIQIPATDLDNLEKLVTTVEQDSCVQFAHYDHAFQDISASYTPNDPWAKDVDTTDWSNSDVDGSNWWMEAIDVYGAWQYRDKFTNIKIGVVDNGFDTDHEDLKITFAHDSMNTLNSKEEHGTHVAGIIGATHNNGKGISGVVEKCELLCFDWQATDRQKETTSWDNETMVYAGLVYTVKSGAKVVNFSIGKSGNFPNGKKYSKKERNTQGKTASGYMATLLKSHDFVVVQSAGNGGVDATHNGLFASITKNNCVTWGTGRASSRNILDRTLIVGAIERTLTGYMASSFSCGGGKVNIAAPGGNLSGKNDQDIYSTVANNKYAALPGTSMAAPMVTGVAALVWSVNPSLTGDQVVDILLKTTKGTAPDNPKSKDTGGTFKIVNAKKAVEKAIKDMQKNSAQSTTTSITATSSTTGSFTTTKNPTASTTKTTQPTGGNSKTITPEEAVDIYMSQKSVWQHDPNYMPMQGYGYCLLDLDFDGVLELITSGNDGSMRASYNSFYKINPTTKKVEKITESDPKDGGLDYYSMSTQAKLLKNQSTGQLFYLIKNYGRVSTDEGTIAYAESYLKNGTIHEEYLFSEYTHPTDYDNPEAGKTVKYDFGDEENLSQSAYIQKVAKFYEDNTNMNLQWDCIYGPDFDKSSASAQRQAMLAAYRAFSYDGFSF